MDKHKHKAVNVIGLGLALLMSSVVQAPAAGTTTAANLRDKFPSPAPYFAYYAKDSADSPWTSAGSQGCAAGWDKTVHAAKIVALSGAEAIVPCHQYEGKDASQPFTEARSRLEADEIQRAVQSRAGFDGNSIAFDPYMMILALLKHDAEAYDDRAWLGMTKTEITQAQSAFSRDIASKAHDWVFTAEELEGRNPDIAAEELMPRFKQEVLRRAKANPDRFILTTNIGNLKYDRATGTMSFGRPAPQGGGIIAKSPLNFKYEGRAVYSVDKGDGVKAFSNDLAKTAGLRSAAAQGAPGVIFDKDIVFRSFQISQEDAERLLNKTQMLTVNLVLSVVDTVRAPGQKGLALRATNGFLYSRIEHLAVSDPAGRLLATYDVAALPASGVQQESLRDRQDIPLKARIFCSSYEKRVTDAKTQRNQRLIGYLEEQYRIHTCDKW